MDDLTAQKQACIDLSKAAVEFFDLLDEYGEDGPWADPAGVAILVRLNEAFGAATGPTRDLASRRLVAVAMASDDPGKMLQAFGMLGGMDDG